MQKLTINKGYKEYQINDDENAVIRINTTDFGLIDRLSKFKKKIFEIVSKIENEKSGDDQKTLADMAIGDKKVRKEIDAVFGDGISNVLFGDLNCLSFAGGQPIVFNFLEAILPVIRDDLNNEKNASDKRMQKYIGAAAQFK